MGRSRSWSGSELGVEVQLQGIDADVLEVLAEEVKLRMAQLPGVLTVDSSLEDGEEEIQVSVDREQALSYGVSASEVASTISTALGTRRTTDFKAPEREIGVVVQLEEADRLNLEQIKNTTFEGRDQTRVQLGALADFDYAEGPRTLQREDRQQTVTVFANTTDRRAAMKLTPAVTAMMVDLRLPPGYSYDLGRASRWVQQDTDETDFTLIFALLLIYLIMASLFESLIHPFTIMFAIPFSLIGVAVGLFAMDIPLDSNGTLGLLILFGIVVNNGIVLVDHINQYRREGMPRREAILRGGQNRMRPILMTAATTMLNLMPLVLPMIYGTSEGFSRRWGPVGLVVVSGLMTSTILTLVLAPTLYSLLDDLSLWMRRVARAARA
jgi:HAE1 family hydrophobic/amphiphilic exporter-1